MRHHGHRAPRTARPASAVSLRRMTDALAHRGPDGEGYYVDGGRPSATGGSRSSTSRRPATSRWRRADGDARHHLQRRDLQLPRAAAPSSKRVGHRFRSRTDTEVVLRRLRASGATAASSASTACSPSRSGTARSGELFLARDRFGIKPLYYAQRGDALLFGSEIKALLRIRRCRRASSTARR